MSEKVTLGVANYDPKRFSSVGAFMCRNTLHFECEACCGVTFVLPIQYFQHTRGVVNNFLIICEFALAMVEHRSMINTPP